MPKINHNASKATKRQLRIRAKLHGSAERPRLSIYRSNKHTSLQVINDDLGLTIASANDKAVKAADKSTKTQKAELVAQAIIEQLKKQKINALVFDRGGYRYHGRVKAVADAMRAAGVQV